MANGGDITLKTNMDISDVRTALSKFDSYIDKAIKSSNTKMQMLGNSLTKVSRTMTETANKMRDLQNVKVPTEQYKQLSKDVDTLGNQYKKAKEQLDRFKNTTMPTQEFTQMQERVAFLNSEISNTQRALKGFQQTPVFRATVAEVNSLEKQLGQARAEVEDFRRRGVESGDAFNAAKEKVNELYVYLRNAEMRQQALIKSGQQFENQASYDRHITMLNIYEQSLEQAKADVQQLIDTGKAYQNTPEYDQKIAEVKRLGDRYLDTLEAKRALERSGGDMQNYTDTSEGSAKMQKLTSIYQDAVRYGNILTNQMDQLGNKTDNTKNKTISLKDAWNSIVKKLKDVSKSHNNVGNSISDLSKTHGISVNKMLKNILKWGFGIRSVFLLYKKIRNVIKTGMSEMAKEFDDVATDVYELKNSWSGFKASIVSAFQPIFSYVVPALTTLINYLTSAMNALANFFAMLTGQSTYYKAKKGIESVNSGVSGTGSAAAEANEELAEYDELIVIDQDNSSGSGGGGGSSSGSDAWQWEEVETTASSLADKLSSVWDKFKSSWEKNGQKVITAAKTALNNLKTLVSTVADTIYDVFMSDAGTRWLDSSWELLTSIFNLIGSIASAWTKAWNDNGTGYNFVNQIFSLLTTINTLLGTITNTFADMFNSEEGYKSLESFLTLATSLLDTIEDVGQAFIDAWTDDGKGYKFVESFFTMFGSINGLLETINESFRNAWNDDGKGAEIIGKILDSWTNINNTITNITDNIKDAWDEAGTGNSIMETILDMVDDIATFVDDISASTLEWSENLDFGDLLESIDTFLTSFRDLLNEVLDIGEDIYDNFILKVVENLVESSLPTVIDSIATSINMIKNTLSLIPFDAIADHVSNFINQKLDEYLPKINSTLRFMSGELRTLVNFTDKVKSLWDKFKDTQLYTLLQSLWQRLQNINSILNTFGVGFKSFDLSDIFAGWSVVDKISNLYDILTNLWDVISQDWIEIGGNIFDGIKQGFEEGVDWKKAVKGAFDAIVDVLKSVFGINSPAKKMNSYGGYIFEGIIDGFKSKFSGNSITTLISTLYTNITSKIKEKFANFSLSDLVKGLGDVAITITTTFKNGITKFAEFTGLDDTLNNIKTGYNNIKTKITSKFEGDITSLDGIDLTKTAFTGLKEKWTDAKATLKAKVGDQLSQISDLTSWGTIFTNVSSLWKDKKASFTATEDATAPKKSVESGDYYTAKTNWKDKKAAFTATENATAPKKSTTSGDYYTAKTNWKDTKASFTATADASAPKKSVSKNGDFYVAKDGWKGSEAKFTATADASAPNTAIAKNGAFYNAKKDWTGSTAQFKTSANVDDASYSLNNANGSLYKLKKSWEDTKAWAEFTYWTTYDSNSYNNIMSTLSDNNSNWSWFTYYATVDNDYLEKAVKKLKDNIQKSLTFQVNAGNVAATGGIIKNGILSRIPQYASGTLNAGSMFIAGEHGPEVMGHINGRTEILNRSQIASIMHSAFVSAMAQFRSFALKMPTDLNTGLLNIANSIDNLADKVVNIKIPDVAQGSILPMTQAFIQTATSSNDNILKVLDSILEILNTPRDDSNPAPIVLQLDGKTVAQVVWDENEKHYRQLGVRYSY